MGTGRRERPFSLARAPVEAKSLHPEETKCLAPAAADTGWFLSGTGGVGEGLGGRATE
jgi:hypothetical protein